MVDHANYGIAKNVLRRQYIIAVVFTFCLHSLGIQNAVAAGEGQLR